MSFDRAQAIRVFEWLLGEVVRMLCAGVVHGDLSDFNVLMSAAGPVIIDFPQSVDAASNQNARKLLLRDVENLKRFLRRFAPDERPGAYAEEMWDLYARSLLTPETRLTGRHRPSERRANTTAVLDLIGDANYDERKRRERQGLGMRGVPTAPAAGNGAGGRPPPRPHPHGARPQGAPPPAEEHRRRQQQAVRPQNNARPQHAAQHRPEQKAAAAATHAAQHRPDQEGHRSRTARCPTSAAAAAARCPASARPKAAAAVRRTAGRGLPPSCGHLGGNAAATFPLAKKSLTSTERVGALRTPCGRAMSDPGHFRPPLA